ncbi:MAG: oligosaccharide flippase family protein [Gammaproteobacteria bacterium]|nr:oligosaccharide flippase family protein [Gammaproteobacteria bacterium]
MSGPAAAYFRTAEIQPTMLALALSPLCGGFENIGTVDFRKYLHFRRDTIFVLAKKLGTFLFAIPLAVWWRNHWALVVGMLAGRVIGLVLSYVLSPYRPRFCLERFREMLHFSKWMLAANVMTFFRLRTVEIWTGRVHGADAVGIYNMSFELASLPNSELVMPINRALFPGFSQVSQDLERLRTGFIKALGLLTLLSTPASVGLALVADVAVPILLGYSWLATIPVIKVLAVAGIPMALQINNWSVMLAIRRPDLWVQISIVHVATLLCAIYFLSPLVGALGGAWAQLIAGLVSLPISYATINRLVGLSLPAILGAIWRPLVAATAMYFAVSPLSLGAQAASLPVPALAANLVAMIVSGAATYGAALLVLWLFAGRPDSAEKMVLQFLRERFAALRAVR